jgi:glutamate formiminotransferase
VPRPIVECVPNVSEGRDGSVLADIADAVRAIRGAALIDVSPDVDHHRTVYTFAGRPEPVLEAAFGVAAAAVARIDLRRHRGVHPRIGAVDVIPFVPLRDCALADCALMAERLAARLARGLHLPVYLYGAAARDPARTLAVIRRGGFEGLRAEIGPDRRRPDYGPPALHPTAGAVAVGARPILIAFNVELAADDLRAAREIAAAVREASGGLPAVQAMGLRLPSRGVAQVSMNLLDYRRTPPLAAFEAVAAEAARRGVGVLGSELVGCAPHDALPPDPGRTLSLRALRREQVLDIDRLARDLAPGPDHDAGRRPP